MASDRLLAITANHKRPDLVKNVLYLSLILLVTSLLVMCKETGTAFSPGAADARITGTWQLVARQFPANVDSVVIDSFLVPAHYEIDSVTKDSVYKKDYYKKTITKLTRSVDSVVRYPAVPQQTISFGADGQLSANGSAMSYYFPIHYFRVDSTTSDGLGIDMYINTNRATIPFRMGLAFTKDTLVFRPRCDRTCYSKFVRTR